MSHKAKKSNRLKTDENGRIIWPKETKAEREARIKSILDSLKAMAAIPDTDPPGSDIEFWKAMDEGREFPLFKDYY